MKKIEGNLAGKGQKVGIIVARFNDFINSNLLSGAMDALTRLGVDEKDITVTYVPGAFEMPLVAIIGSISFSALVGLFFGIWPANKAAKLDPVIALRHE